MSLKWKWRYQSAGDSGEDEIIKARGTLFTSSHPNEDGFYEVKRIRGRRDGDMITGLVDAGTSVPGNAPYAGDNLIRPKIRKRPQLTGSGLQFSLDNGEYSNVFYADFLAPPSYLEFHSVPPYPDGPNSPNTELGVVFKAFII